MLEKCNVVEADRTPDTVVNEKQDPLVKQAMAFELPKLEAKAEPPKKAE